MGLLLLIVVLILLFGGFSMRGNYGNAPVGGIGFILLLLVILLLLGHIQIW